MNYEKIPWRFGQRLGTLLLITGVAVSGAALCQSTGGSFELTSSVIAAGGGASAADTYALDATTGQSDASGALSGGVYEIAGGFQPIAGNDSVFSNGFE